MAIPALAHVDDLVKALDALVTQPTRGRGLPVVVFEDDGTRPGHAEAFVSGYGKRLRVDPPEGDPQGDHIFCVPRAVATAQQPGAAMPDVDLLDRLVSDWENTMPAGTGRLRVPLFRTCREALDALLPGEAPPEADVPQDPARAMAQGLWTAWQRRTPVLGAMRQAIDNGALPGWLAGVLTVALSWPLELWHRWRLNRTMRWYTRRVTHAGPPARNFVQAALYLRAADAEQQALLRMNLLLEALFMDLSKAVAPSRFRPGRRRRVWPFVLLVPDAAAEENTAARQLLATHRELVAQGARPPLLVLAGHPDRPTTELLGSPPLSVEEAAAVLSRARSQTPAEKPARIAVRLPDGPEQSDVARWLRLNARVMPKEVGAVRAHAGWVAATTVLVTLGCTAWLLPVQWSPWDPRCPRPGTAGEEVVGIAPATKGCYFTGLKSQELLRKVQDQIREQNAAVTGEHRTVVFLAPLTADPRARREQIVPAGVVQLQGAADAQKAWNGQTTINENMPPLKIVVANTGFAFGKGRAVADQVRELAARDKTVAAVIGITQSRQESVDAINRLGESMPVIGASVTGDFMAEEAHNFFHTQPTNARMAQVMVRHALGLGGKKALIVYDKNDRYSKELRDDIAGELKARGIVPEDPWFAQVPAPTPENSGLTALGLPDLAGRICALRREKGITFYASRGTQLPKVLAEVQATCGGDDDIRSSPIPIVASDVNTLIEYEKVPGSARVQRYTAVGLYYISFSNKPVRKNIKGGSDYASGGDSFRAAAAAIETASAQSGGSASPSNVLQALRNSVDVRDSNASDRNFTLPLTDKERARRPLFLCLAPHSPELDSHGKCTRPDR